MQWTSPEQTAIRIINADGSVTTVPAVAGNRAYDEILASGVEIQPYEAPPTPPPATATPYQARMALLGAGLLDQVEALMLHPDTPQAAKIAWEYATVIDRNSAFIESLGPALGLTEEDIDALFVAASQVT